MFMPNTTAATRNRAKLERYKAQAPSETPIAAEIEPIAKPAPRPILRINNVAGTVVVAVAITMTEMGRVDHARFSVSVAPIMPPSVTNTIEPVAEISWQNTSRIKLRRCMAV